MKQDLYVISYEHIDYLECVWKPDDLAPQSLPCSQEEAEAAFREAGWEGDGLLGIIWVPPFMLRRGTWGIIVWHVKQNNNGTSWLLTDTPFEMDNGYNKEWRLSSVKADRPDDSFPF